MIRRSRKHNGAQDIVRADGLRVHERQDLMPGIAVLEVKTLSKQLAERHINELIQVQNEAWPAGEPSWSEREFLADSIGGGSAPLEGKWVYSQAAFYGGKVVGYLMGYRRGDVAVASRFAVKPEFQKKSTGVMLMLARAALEAVERDGIREVETGVAKTNPAFDLYRKIGSRL